MATTLPRTDDARPAEDNARSSRFSGDMRSELASLTAKVGGRRKQFARLGAKAKRRYAQLLRQSLRWTAPDGSMLLGATDSWDMDLLRTALRLVGDKRDAAAVRRLLGDKAVGKSIKGRKKTPIPSSNAETAATAILRSDWTPSASIVAVDFSRPTMRLEIWAEGKQLSEGDWHAHSQVEGDTLIPTGVWQQTCWFHDKDVAYVEFALDLAGGARLERQIALGRRDGMLLLVDHLKNPQSAALQHSWQIPLAPPIAFRGEDETRDGFLLDERPVGRVIPLGLPEWRVDPRGGELTSRDGQLRLSQHATATALACPAFIDLKPGRCTKQSTWRQLTVAEWLVIQPVDVAVAYRVQSGKKQWVYYRSQTTAGNRTFLGQNTSSECIIARFMADTGGIEELVEIEA